MGDCRCGCGEEASNGDFIAGHSQKLTSRLFKQVGGLFAMQELIQSAKKFAYGGQDPETFLSLVRRLFPAHNLK